MNHTGHCDKEHTISESPREFGAVATVDYAIGVRQQAWRAERQDRSGAGRGSEICPSNAGAMDVVEFSDSSWRR